MKFAHLDPWATDDEEGVHCALTGPWHGQEDFVSPDANCFPLFFSSSSPSSSSPTNNQNCCSFWDDDEDEDEEEKEKEEL